MSHLHRLRRAALLMLAALLLGCGCRSAESVSAVSVPETPRPTDTRKITFIDNRT